ncbi:ATP-binding protein [Kribbella sp. NPDC050470]|uniref:ATP-binding protein n=1 Tax=unclassified Kribbella TaxID=2644121 RepID=UPI00378F704B
MESLGGHVAPGPSSPWPGLRGRRTECETLAGLVQAARSGRSAVVVVLGEPGIGKTAILDFVAESAPGAQTLRVSGVESQMELAFAGLHQLCGPLLDGLERLPLPQANALSIAFGLRSGNPPDRFLIGLAALTLLSEAAGDGTLVCLVDDAQWLDQASAEALTFVARRLVAEAVVLVFAVRTGQDPQKWAGLPYLTLRGLPEEDAEALLDSALTGPVDDRVRRRILAEAHGNPLALLELPRWWTTAELTFGPQPAQPGTLTRRMEEGFRRELETLPGQSRRLLLTAAAEPLGDVGLLWRAAARIGLGVDDAVPAQKAGLIELQDTVRFRHPLVRSVAYGFAATPERQAVHRALADATDPDLDPDRRAWHLAHAATGPDEAVAAELEHCAGRALAQGGLAAAAAFLEHAALLTPEAADRTERQLSAVELMLHAGTFEAALNLLAVAEHGPLGDLQRARIDVLRAQIGFASRRGNEALPRLLAAAQRLEPLAAERALDSYLDALTAALFAGRLASGPGPAEVAQAARNAPSSTARLRRGDLLLHGVAVLFAENYPAAAPLLRRATEVFDSDHLSLEEGVRFMWLAAVVASDLWDERAWDRLTRRHLRIVREAGALSALPLALNTRVYVDLFAGELSAAGGLVEEIRAVTEAAETSLSPYAAIGLAAFRGREDPAAALIAASLRDVTARGEGIGVSLTNWARAMLCNGLGRYPEAMAAGREAAAFPAELGVSNWGLVELIEAAVRAGDRTTAATAFEQLSAMTQASGTDWALGVAARSEAQLYDGTPAEDRYREAIDRLERTAVRTEVARARLLYGEWLRRDNRRVESRLQLRVAHDAFTAMGMAGFAERARHELAATGETPRKRTAATQLDLTAQELHIARLAAQGLSNPEIGAELFISPRTVEWHLRKVFAKLGINARRHLRDALKTTEPV